MSGLTSVTGSSNLGMLQQLLDNATSVKSQFDQLTEQAASGYAATTYAGLGASKAGTALSIAPQISGIANTIGNLNAVATRMNVQQNALASISSIATSFMSQIGAVNDINPEAMATIAASAKQALSQVGNLLNTESAGVYVFAGQDSANPPVPDPSNIANTGFYTQIGTAVAGLATNGAAATEAATQVVASSNAPSVTPFSASLSSGSAALPVVATGDGQTAVTGILANTNGFVTSAGAGTTGSYMRDILRGLATIAQLTPAQVGTSDFTTFAQDTAASMQSAVTALNQDAGTLGNTQSSLSAQATSLQQTSDALSTQLAGAEQVDMATTLSKLSATQTQLQASYQLIASMKTMSLTQYL